MSEAFLLIWFISGVGLLHALFTSVTLDDARGVVDLEHLHEYLKQLSCRHRIVQILFAIHVFMRSVLDVVILLLTVSSVLLSGNYVTKQTIRH